MKKTFISLTCFLLLGLNGHSQDGTLDLTFGNNGFALVDGYFNYLNKGMQAIQPDGKIVEGGTNFEGDIVILRLNSNGSLDNGFSDGGKFTITGSAPWIGVIFDIEIQSDGKIIVLFSQGLKKSILRLTNAGVLDFGFGNNGIVETNFAYNLEYSTIIAQESGKIIMLENVYDEPAGVTRHGEIQRLNNDGSIDITFGVNGEITLGNPINLYIGVQRESDNSIIYCEAICEQNNCRFLFKQLNYDGSSYILFDIEKQIGGFGDFKVQPNGRLYIGGSLYNSVLTRVEPAVFCYNSIGELVTDFDDDGIKIIPVDGEVYGFITRIEIQKDDCFLLSGYLAPANDEFDHDRFLIKLKPDGSLDQNFNESGIFRLETINDENNGIDYPDLYYGEFSLQEDGKILLCGHHWDNTYNYFGLHIFRLHNSVLSCSQTNLTSNIADAFAVNPGGAVNTIYLGYGPSSLTLTAQVTGGNPNYTYNWSNGQTGSTATVSPNTVGSHIYTFTVTDATGCTSSATKIITVIDIRTQGKPGKVNICHRDLKGKWTTLSVLAGSVPEHLAHGDYLGNCIVASNSEILTSATKQSTDNEVIHGAFKLYPNPATDFIDVQWVMKNTSQSMILILNAEGRVVKTLTTKMGAMNQRISLTGLAKGIFILELRTGADIQVSKFVIQ